MNQDELKRELVAISDYLLQYDVQQLSTVGIRYGKLGVSLFNLIYSRFTGDERHYDKATSIINTVVQDVMENNISEKRVVENIVDFGKFMEFVNKNKLYDVDTNAILSDLDDFLLEQMEILFEEGDYDVIGGALSIGYYFLLRHHSYENSTAVLQNVITKIRELALKDKDGQFYWKSTLFEGDRIYLGIHGSSAMILFCLRLLALGIEKDTCLEIIEKSCRFIINLDFTNDLSRFPVIIGYPVERGPLEWAYGDLLVGYVLYAAGIVLDNEVFKKRAIDAYDFAAGRINDKDVVVDAGLVHGISGTAMMFDKMYLLTGEVKYRKVGLECCNLARTKFKSDPNGPLGFKAKYDIDCPGSDISFMSGISGIGIAFIAILDREYYYFDELLFF